MAKPRKKATKLARTDIRKTACIVLALASNIFSPLVPPLWGVALAIVGIALYIYSFLSFEIWIRNHIKTNPVASIIFVTIILAVLAIPTAEGISAWKQHVSDEHAYSDNPCPAGSRLILNDIKTDASNLPPTAHAEGIHIEGDPCTTINGAENKGTVEGIHIEPATKTRKK